MSNNEESILNNGKEYKKNQGFLDTGEGITEGNYHLHFDIKKLFLWWRRCRKAGLDPDLKLAVFSAYSKLSGHKVHTVLSEAESYFLPILNEPDHPLNDWYEMMKMEAEDITNEMVTQ